MSHRRLRLETIKVTLIVVSHTPSGSLWILSADEKKKKKRYPLALSTNTNNEKYPLTTTNNTTEVACAGADSKLCFPAFMSIELKVSA